MKNSVIIATKNIHIISGVNSFIDDVIRNLNSEFELEIEESKNWLDILTRNSVIYWHDFYSPHLLLLLLFNRIYKRSIVIVSHGSFTLTHWTSKPLLKRTYMNLVEFLSSKKVRFQYLNLEEYCSSFQFKNFFISAPPLPEVQGPLNIPSRIESSRVKLLYISALQYNRKGYDRLLSFVQELNNSHIEFTFHIIGSESKEFFKYPEFTALKNVEFMGKMERSSIYELFRQADYVCLFSRSEGFPISLLEAVIHHVPVIVTKETNFSYFLERYQLGYSYEDICIHLEKLQIKPNSDFEGFRKDIIEQNVQLKKSLKND